MASTCRQPPLTEGTQSTVLVVCSAQGALRRYKSKHGNGFTRDYGALWARMLQLRKQGVAVPPVVVVGKGERRHLMLPRELESSVTFHPWLKYQVRRYTRRVTSFCGLVQWTPAQLLLPEVASRTSGLRSLCP